MGLPSRSLIQLSSLKRCWPLAFLVFAALASTALATAVADLLVIGVDIDPADPRAYPIEILDYHEIVNDVIAGRHVAITWGPLTYSNMLLETESLLRYVFQLVPPPRPLFSFSNRGFHPALRGNT